MVRIKVCVIAHSRESMSSCQVTRAERGTQMEIGTTLLAPSLSWITRATSLRSWSLGTSRAQLSTTTWCGWTRSPRLSRSSAWTNDDVTFVTCFLSRYDCTEHLLGNIDYCVHFMSRNPTIDPAKVTVIIIIITIIMIVIAAGGDETVCARHGAQCSQPGVQGGGPGGLLVTLYSLDLYINHQLIHQFPVFSLIMKFFCCGLLFVFNIHSCLSLLLL